MQNSTNAKFGLETMSSAMMDAKNYSQWIVETLKPWLVAKKKLLEIGPGFGQYTHMFCSMVDEVVAVDASHECLQRLKPSPNLTRVRSDLSKCDFVEKLKRDEFDAVVALNVLEHIEDDRLALKNIFRILKPKGVLILLVPAIQALFGPMDKMAGHHRRYSKRRLKALLEYAGFETAAGTDDFPQTPLCCSTSESHHPTRRTPSHDSNPNPGNRLFYFNPLGGLGWWLNAVFFHPKTLSADSINLQILFFDSYLIPFSKVLNPYFQDLFGQSVWAFAQKPD